MAEGERQRPPPAVRAARRGTASTDAAPGKVIACDDLSGLQVATASGTVALTRLSTLAGEALTISDLTATDGVTPGMLLIPVDALRHRITEAGTRASRAGAYWRGWRMTEPGHPYRLPHPPPASADTPDTSPITTRCLVPVAGPDELSAVAYLAGAWYTFLCRASAEKDFYLAVAAPRGSIDAAYRDLFAAWVPLRADIDPARSIA